MRYAKNTYVSVERSRGEVERTLKRYGADEFAYATRSDKSMIVFKMNDRAVRFVVPMPNRSEYSSTPTGQDRSENQIEALLEQGIRQRWRALLLAIKAKLECVETGISTFEDEFLAYFVMANGQTVGDMLKPQLEKATSNKKSLLMLEGPREGERG